jgi:hypothetical protein
MAPSRGTTLPLIEDIVGIIVQYLDVPTIFQYVFFSLFFRFYTSS